MSQAEDNSSTVCIVPEMTGQCGTTRVTFLNTPFRFWHDTGVKTYAEPGFGSMLLDEIYNKQGFFARQRGFLIKKPCCRFCGAALSTSLLDIGLFAIELCPPGYGVCQIRIEVPAAVCGVCRTHNAIKAPHSERRIHQSIVNALGSDDCFGLPLMIGHAQQRFRA
jgi:hypothetical protein